MKTLFAIAIATIVLTGCNTIAGFGKDVQKESVAELAASGLAWTDVQKAVSTAARDWFKQKVEGSIFEG